MAIFRELKASHMYIAYIAGSHAYTVKMYICTLLPFLGLHMYIFTIM